MIIELSAAATAVIDRLNDRGYEAFAVGGCVRDALLGHPAKDWDVCTNALPHQILAAFHDFSTIPTGIQHGTVTVLSDGQPVEVTTYRIDGDYSDFRHPDGVTFTASLREDLARRDFTINAMAYHPDCGLVDLYEGKKDLQRRVIRCVGESSLRFREDALRILRGLRFSSVLDFALSEDTVTGMHQTARLLPNVAVERVYQELSKLICGKAAARVFTEYADLLFPLIPFAEMPQKGFDPMDELPRDLCLRFGFLYRGNPKALQGMNQLRAPKAVARRAATLAEQCDQPLKKDRSFLRRKIFELGYETTEQLVNLQVVLGVCPPAVAQEIGQIKEQNLCCTYSDLNIRGEHLLAQGFPAGKEMGELLRQLLYAVMDGAVENDQEQLLAYAKQLVLK